MGRVLITEGTKPGRAGLDPETAHTKAATYTWHPRGSRLYCRSKGAVLSHRPSNTAPPLRPKYEKVDRFITGKCPEIRGQGDDRSGMNHMLHPYTPHASLAGRQSRCRRPPDRLRGAVDLIQTSWWRRPWWVGRWCCAQFACAEELACRVGGVVLWSVQSPSCVYKVDGRRLLYPMAMSTYLL